MGTRVDENALEKGQMTNLFRKPSTRPHTGEKSDLVYLLWHTDATEDEKLIGVYRTEVDGLAAIERVKDKPGFAEEGKFECAEYELNRDYWSEGCVRGDG